MGLLTGGRRKREWEEEKQKITETNDVSMLQTERNDILL